MEFVVLVCKRFRGNRSTGKWGIGEQTCNTLYGVHGRLGKYIK